MSHPAKRLKSLGDAIGFCEESLDLYGTTLNGDGDDDDEYYSLSNMAIDKKEGGNGTVNTEDVTGQTIHADTGNGKGAADIATEEASEHHLSDAEEHSDGESDTATGPGVAKLLQAAKKVANQPRSGSVKRRSHSSIYRKITGELKKGNINEDSWSKYMKIHKSYHPRLLEMREAVETKLELEALKAKFPGMGGSSSVTGQASTATNGTDRMTITLDERKLIEWLRHHKSAKKAFMAAFLDDGDLSKYLKPLKDLSQGSTGSQSPSFSELEHFKKEHHRVAGLVFDDWYDGTDISAYMAPLHSRSTETISPYINKIAEKLGYEHEAKDSSDESENDEEDESDE